jgi:hypothetical protein
MRARYSSLSSAIHQLFFPPRLQFVALEKDANRLPAQAKEIIYRAFIEDELDAPKHLARVIHHEYFEPAFPDFAPRTKWSLQNAFTSGFKLLEPIGRTWPVGTAPPGKAGDR